ncbi:MAG TPA: anion transporter [Kiritimatiellia bacterium]|nr:anion transporter [Kiritimatiellia bacterium]HRZ12835.1 anion transporter [Kiritimatiellia bacterium]HSA18213.1 anion transporter [Kiritimatiellia bacterium]
MPRAALIIFAVTYIGVALGRLPGLALDRTGMALLGGIAMVVAGVLSEREALLAIDFPTLGLLYALMVLSAQLRLGGFYTRVALAVARLMDRPARFLLILMAVSAALSAILVNDIICLAFTPILAVSLLRSGLNPVPFLIGLAVSSNIGSAATIIGNPQNMLIGQVGRLHFGRFLLWCGPPSLLALLAAFLIIAWLYRGRWRRPAPAVNPASDWPAYNPHQAAKGVAATVILVALFFTPIPRELSAIVVAGVLLCSRKMQTRWILDLVDWHLITLFAGLFVVIRGIEAAGLPDALLAALQERGVDIRQPGLLTLVSAALSNLVSNVPATMLLVKFLDPADPVPWYVMALAMTYAGNLLTIGSIANLIVIEQAKPYGIHIGFREHARAGIPVTIISLLIAIGWIWWRA